LNISTDWARGGAADVALAWGKALRVRARSKIQYSVRSNWEEEGCCEEIAGGWEFGTDHNPRGNSKSSENCCTVGDERNCGPKEVDVKQHTLQNRASRRGPEKKGDCEL